MSRKSDKEGILKKTEEQERRYDWLAATESCKRIISFIPEDDFSEMGRIRERMAYAFYRAAMQVENENEFGKTCSKAIKNYEIAKEFYGRRNGTKERTRMLRCSAMIALIGYWLAPKALEKKSFLDECWRLTNEALRAFEEAGEALEYGKTFNQLSTSALFKLFLEWDHHTREETMKDAVDHGERAVRFLSTRKDSRELVRAYVKTAAYLEVFGFSFLDLDKRGPYYQKASDYWKKASQLSEETAMIELLDSAAYAALESLGWGFGSDKALANFGKALEYGGKTRDRLIIGCALDWLAYHTFWKAISTEDQDERAELGKRALRYAEDARHHYSSISFISLRGGSLWVESPQGEYYWHWALREADLMKRRDLLEKAVEAARGGSRRAEISGYPDLINYSHHVLSKTLVDLAKIETNPTKRQKFLEEALEHRNESIKITEELEPFMYWNRGAMRKYLADIKSELADLATNPETRKHMLQEALLDKENCLALCIKHMSFWETTGSVSEFAVLGSLQYSYGNSLNRLHEITGHEEYLKRAAKAFEDAAESYQKPGQTSRMAECFWKAAQVYDILGEHLRAAENFDHASDSYRRASEKIPQLRDFYQDHALYMQAWSEIERARHHHRRQEYGSAREHFEKAANLHKTLAHWSYLASNYSAWVQVEHAEELSRKEQSEEAIQAFIQAVKLFKDARDSLQTQFNTIEDLDEKQATAGLLKATGLRREYCRARIALEEARVLGKKGEHYASSEKYDSAIEAFEKTTKVLESEQERREIMYITSLSRAWRKMTRAEAEVSPALYMEASQLFEEAKELGPSEKAKMLALGHSHFCRALEAGTRFADTRDVALHTKAAQQLESAADYYLKADFQNASEYAQATKLLFDAYLHMDNAARESDPEKRAKLYMMTEKVLQTSAGCYLKAEYPAKREQVLKLLERVKGERELAMYLANMLQCPIIASTTAFPAPTPTSEKSVGLNPLEHAEIQANIVTSQKELRVGESLDLEIELANAGKGPALLTRIVETTPQGFEITEKPETYRVEDGCLNMKAKRLDPLKTEEVKLVLKPTRQGTFTLRPTILYLDENGKKRSHEPEPITITVKELGISGWLKGPKKTK